MIEVVKDSYEANKRICFGGDNYAEEWHAEAEQRGLKNLRTTPDALPEVLADADGRRRSRTTTCSPSASWSRATRSGSSSTSIRANIEAETARDDRAGR